VQVADDRLASQHGLALELQHEAQHPVRGRVLRPHVDDHRLILVGIVGQIAEHGRFGLGHPQHGADLAQQFLGREFTARAELLLAFVGAGHGALVEVGARLGDASVGVGDGVGWSVSGMVVSDIRCSLP
jgi:hypothetical protein